MSLTDTSLDSTAAPTTHDEQPNASRLAFADDHELISRATSAYQRWCTRSGCQFDQPCKYTSEVDRGDRVTITLANTNGELARYVVAGERLQRLPDEEADSATA